MNANFDYIIIGAGSAGCVLANRLSANGKYSVLVLEAGGSDNKFWIQTPIGYGKTFFDSKVNWKYQTENEPGLNHRSSYWPRGKILGGSSSINAMVYIRGNQQDFDDWQAMGNPGWGWHDVLPYFKKSETNANGGNDYRGDNGPLYVNDVSDQYHPLCKHFFSASKQTGFELNPDFNGQQQEGIGYYQITTKNGVRMSTARAYLKPALKKKNCSIKTRVQVTRLLCEDNKTIGVEYLKNRKIQHALANREVILSAGSINSPQILQLSGIGPAKPLQDLGITIIRENESVGKNLQDHLAITHYYKSKVPTLNNQLYPWWGKLWAGMQYILTRKGVLSLSVNQAGGFVKSTITRPRPNLQMYFAAITYNTSPPGKRPLMQPDPFSAFLNSVSQCRPTSRGEVLIKSKDPLQHPTIKPNYLSTDYDVQELLEGVGILRKMAQTPAFKEIIEEEFIPGEKVVSDEELIHDIRQRSDTVYHPTSTCIMGANPKTSVVNNQLRVHGIKNLRIVDASVFPTIISGNTNAAVIMLAEKAADMILHLK